MIRVLFVCLGNICRSPMAEMMFKDLVKKQNLQKDFLIDSCATSYEEDGNPMHRGAVEALKRHGIYIDSHRARRLQKADYDKYDYIICMDESNIYNIMRIISDDSKDKVHRLLDYSNNPRDILDPWYSLNFEKTYEDLSEGLSAFLEYLKSNDKL